MFGVDTFGDFAEYATCHQTTRCRQARLLNGYDTAVLRIFRWEIAAEANQVLHGTRLVTSRTFGYLGSTCLSRYMELLGACRFSQSLADHLLQNDLYLFDGLGRSDGRVQDFCRNLFNDLPVLDNGFHKLRLHHDPIVGNGIVECQCVHWWNLCFVTDGHPWQGCLVPILLGRFTDIRLLGCTRNVQFQRSG